MKLEHLCVGAACQKSAAWSCPGSSDAQPTAALWIAGLSRATAALWIAGLSWATAAIWFARLIIQPTPTHPAPIGRT